ncbi:S-layer homology domain-containing protein [bacterium]|nr:S-layer homology domain-containing protein [bacterium]
MNTKLFYAGAALLVILMIAMTGCGPKPTPQESLFDTPDNHYTMGMRAYDNGDLGTAAEEFRRATDLDPDYPGGYVGMGLVLAAREDFKEAVKSVEKGIGKDKNFIDGYIGYGRILTTWKRSEDWIEDAVKQFEKALKISPDNEKVLFYLGIARKEAFQFGRAADIFRQVIAMKGEYGGAANTEWELVQKIQRAAPGTKIGMKIALIPEIDRSDIAVLFIEELKLLELLDRYRKETYDTGFRTPEQEAKLNAEQAPPEDIQNHWAKNWIESVIKSGVMTNYPDGNFHPDELITRANYAVLLQNILIHVTSDPSLATKYIGTVSRFPDVNPSHYAYNAICLAVDRGIMKADTMKGTFGMKDSVSGADALLIIRELQNALRMTF